MAKSINTVNGTVVPYTGSKHFDVVLSNFIENAFDIDLSSEVSNYRHLLINLIKNNGKKYAATRLKALYNYGIKVSLEFTDIKTIPWMKSDKSGFPHCIKSMKKYLLSSNFNHRRAALTVLRQYETIFCDPEPDLETISKPGPDPKIWSPYRDNWKDFIKRNFNKISPTIEDTLLHMTSHNGPNGPAMIRAHIDALAINQNKKLKQAIFELYSIPVKESDEIIHLREQGHPIPTRIEKKTKVFESTLALGEKLIPRLDRMPLHSRLQFLAVGGCKTRTIAILDLFSQDALLPLHKWAYKFLSKLQTDGTFSHNRVSKITLRNTAKRKPTDCFDLTAATDRFPSFLQEEFLSVVTDESIAQSWLKVMTERQFSVPNSPNSLEYKCGQPMGGLSSWAIFALTHHAFVEYCAFLEGIEPFREYVIIGDDVAIFNRKVASRYESMLNLLEVPISKDKSISSNGGNSPSRGEIAKRIFLNGRELSPIPTGAIYQGWKDVLLFPNLVRLCQERGVETFYQTAPVHSLCKQWLSITDIKRVGALLFYPGDQKPLFTEVSDWNPWEQFESEDINEVFTDVLRQRLTDKADAVYKDLIKEIDKDPIWGGLMDDLYDPNLPMHPVNLMTRYIRDKVSQTYMEIKSNKDFDPFEIDFIFDPLIRDYRRMSHRRTKIKGILIERTLKKLTEEKFNRENILNEIPS